MSLFKFKRKLLLEIKNKFGWSTDRKIIVFSVDDYGNVRTASKHAREKMKQSGLNVESNRFDYYDALENEEDMESLYSVLNSVKDMNGNPAVFTTFSMSANPDFEKIIASNYKEYYFESLDQTYKKNKGCENVLTLIKQGITNKLICPQFHGREHLNIKMFNTLLNEKNKEIITAINNNSYSSIYSKPFKNISYASAFSFEYLEDLEGYKDIIRNGLKMFKNIYGYKPKHFTAPGIHAHRNLEETLKEEGIEIVDTDLIKKEHQGKTKFKRFFNYTGKLNRFNQFYFVRNCVYEPLLSNNINWEDYCMMQIESAFSNNKVANISSHRVNFGGQIEVTNRENGLAGLQSLLKKILAKWPDVEFMATIELLTLMRKDV